MKYITFVCALVSFSCVPASPSVQSSEIPKGRSGPTAQGTAGSPEGSQKTTKGKTPRELLEAFDKLRQANIYTQDETQQIKVQLEANLLMDGDVPSMGWSVLMAADGTGEVKTEIPGDELKRVLTPSALAKLQQHTGGVDVVNRAALLVKFTRDQNAKLSVAIEFRVSADASRISPP